MTGAADLAMRQAALLRVRGRRPFWGIGCIEPVARAWPDAFAGWSAGRLTEIYREAGVAAVLRAVLGPPADDAAPLTADPVLAEIETPDGPAAVAGLAVGAFALVATADGHRIVPARIRARWDAAAFGEGG